MPEFLQEFFDRYDINDNKLLFIGLILLLIPIFFLVSFNPRGVSQKGGSRIETQGLSKQSAFNLTARNLPAQKASGAYEGGRGAEGGRGSSHSYSQQGTSGYSSYASRGIDTRSSGLGVKPNIEKIEEQLEAVLKRIQSTPRERKYPHNATPELRHLIDAEHDETYLEALSSMDRADRKTAEKLFRDLIHSSAGNKFKALYGWGGLMEIYQIEEDKTRFKSAFSEYVKLAQELKEFYGPLADSVAAAYNMLEQLEHIDPGLVKEALTKYNLENKTNLRYEDMIGAFKETKSWYPSDVKMSADLEAKLKKEGGN